MLIAFYISGHGFGHASRDAELMRAIRAIAPDTRFAVRTTVPERMFADVGGVDVQRAIVDTGMVQNDSLSIDEPATTRAIAAFHADFDRRVDAEAATLRALRPGVVIGDIPPLAFAAAAKASVPSVAVGNFTWDWIYGAYPDIARAAPGALPAMRDAYAKAALALRLPLHGGFEPMAAVTRDIPFIARRSDRDPMETRRLLGISDGRPVVLPAFGAYGLDLPYAAVERDQRVVVLRPDGIDLEAFGLRYQDLVAAADVVLSKPGYGIVSECVANGTSLLYTSRGRFIEYDLFVSEMPRVLRCRYVSQEDLRAGRWADAVHALLAQPEVARPRVDGADVAAATITRLLDHPITR
jgi:hypothetical protein